MPWLADKPNHAADGRFGTASKAGLLAQSARFDLCGNCGRPGSGRQRSAAPEGRWIYPSALPDGRTVRLLKVLQTNRCTKNCLYCENRVSRDIPRDTFSPEELARLFENLRSGGAADGLFLSSSVSGRPDGDMARMIATAELLRRRFRFRGYIHMKILPGASRPAIEAAARLADRISINLEAPGPAALARIAAQKEFPRDIEPQIAWIQQAVEDPGLRARSHTTQFVVGAAGESDLEILRSTDLLYRKRGLERAYFSAYQPPDESAPLTSPPVPLMREHRLYQADFLLRRYRFELDELVFQADGLLSLEVDPKQAWAGRHPEFFPVDLARAPLELLLRVPGIGPVSAKRICSWRRSGVLREGSDLKQTGVVLGRAAPYSLWKGRRVSAEEGQPSLPFRAERDGDRAEPRGGCPAWGAL
ncbi:MAG: radical SAM protein [bacterium]